ncbi:MAG: hypothetical protein ACRD15_12360 [Vicinamibacterales bacterium]
MKPTDPPPPQASAGHDRYDDGVAHHQPGAHDDLHNEDVAHEHTDVHLGAIGTSVVVLSGVALVSMFAMYVLLGWFERQAAASDTVQSPLAAPPTEMPKTTNESPFFSTGVTAGPLLLTSEPTALQKQRAGEQERLHGGGWVNEQAGIAFIPIEEAKKLVVQRGLPVREGGVAPTFAVRPPARGEASGGRTITVPPPEPTPTAPGQQTPRDPAQPPAAKPQGPGGH